MLDPQSIAIVGASDNAGNLGGTAISYLLRFGYKGSIIPVNPKREFVHGLACFKSVHDVDRATDLAILATPGPAIPELVRECAAAGIANGVAWAGGFAEVGEQGGRLQADLAAACRETNFKLLGPNCIGFINTEKSATATFASFLSEEESLIPGSISMVSQSGGLATMLHALAQRASAGLRYMISTGNEVVLTACDFIDALVDDEGTSVIACYLEGVTDGEQLQRSLYRAHQTGKPVVVLKGGLAPTSARAAKAHTGAIAGEGRVWRAVLNELGAVVVSSLGELLDVAIFLSTEAGRRVPAGNRLAVVTFGGGNGVIAVDQCLDAGLTPTPLSDETRAKLRPLVPPIASTENPVDLTPQAFNDTQYLATLGDALLAVAQDDGIDGVLCVFGPMSVGLDGVIDAVSTLQSGTGKSFCIAWPLAPKGAFERMRKRGIHVFADSAPALAVLAKIIAASRAPDQVMAAGQPPRLDWPTMALRATAGTVIPEHTTHEILRAAAIPVAAGVLAIDEDTLFEAIQKLGTPLAMKAVSADITHRDAAGLVYLNVANAEDASEIFKTITQRSDALGLRLDGVYVQQMVPDGEELLVSVFRDLTFGHMLSCGSGGTRTNFLDDVVLARAPVTPSVASDLLQDLRIVRYASGSGRHIEPLAAFVAAISQVGASAPWQQFTLEINPVKWRTDEVIAVDGLLVVEQP
jgi:acyl-CoA synthetase (NDP forming)